MLGFALAIALGHGQTLPVASNAPDLTITVNANRSFFRAGQKANITVTLKNTSGRQVSWMAMLGKPFDVRAVRRADNVEVWRWSKGRMFPMIMGQVNLKPGESLKRDYQWNFTDENGKPVRPGLYSIFAEFTPPRTPLTIDNKPAVLRVVPGTRIEPLNDNPQ